MNPFYPLVAERALFICEYCQAPQDGFVSPMEVEHIIPTKKQGTNAPENLALACRSCNGFKGDATTAPDPETADEVPLFDPRRDDWDEHFDYDAETFFTEGRTATGRATVSRLQMNNPFQIGARRTWRKAGLPF